MSTKEERPTLAGVNVKTRKRNIVIPSDPGSFADAVIQIFQDASEGVSVEKDLEAAAKVLDSTDNIDFSRYADTLFEVLFAGGRLATGGNLADEGGSKLATNILATAPERDAILPYVKVFQVLIRRRAFLIRGLENTLCKFLLSLEFYDEVGRQKIAIATSLVFSTKVGLLQEKMFNALLNDRLVAKGTVLEFITNLFKEYLAQDTTIEDLVALLTKAKVAHRLLDFFPPGKRNLHDLSAHFKAAGLEGLVEWNSKRELDAKVGELQAGISKMVSQEEEGGSAAAAAELLAYIRGRQGEGELPDGDVLRVTWTALVASLNMTGKNQQQITQGIAKLIKNYRKVLAAFASSGRSELALLTSLQVQCYEDTRLLKQFADIVKMMYDCEVIGEDTILHWYKKGGHPKGRNVFMKDIEPFIKWLEEAEEDEEAE